MSARLVVDLLRHGACEGGAIYRGSTDSPLSAEGRRQMQAALAPGGWDRILCSPLQRCRVPAQHYAGRQGLRLSVDPALREMDFGCWEGLSLASVWQAQQERVVAFWQDPVAHPPDQAEPLTAVQARSLSVLEALVKVEGDQRVLLVTHGGVIRVILCQLLQMPLQALQQLTVDYASLTRVELYPEENGYRSQVIFCNRLPDLDAYA